MAASDTKTNYDTLKENIGMVVLVPTLLGGLWQIMELASLGTPYLRFFSLSQLVSDGLLILFILTFTALPLWWYFKDADMPRISFKGKGEKEDKMREEDRIPEKRIIYNDGQKVWVSKKNGYYYLSTFTILYLIILIFVIWPEIIEPLRHETKTSVLGLLGLFFLITFTLLYLRILFRTIFQIHTWKINYDHKVVRDTITSLLTFSFFGLIIFCFYFTRLFHRSFLFPEDLKNQQYINCIIKRNNPGLKKFNIDYFNDKYVFVSITNEKNKKHLEIFKFEDFLDDTACDLNQTKSIPYP